ncbi:MAG: signal peptidase I [Candidatus Magasanikbacteria bacterium]|jgi:signal peptidase I|nr:signal peptidase I [Candidatus Magasanikbacteria bacterium]
MPEEQDKVQQETPTNEPPKRHFVAAVGLFFLELIKIGVLAGITIGLVRYFLFKPFYVKGESMEPSFYAGEYLIIDELTYRFREPKRGEVFVIHAPLATTKDFYLKRVIGLPGERVRVEDNKVIVYNNEHPEGIVLDEEYLVETTPGSIHYTLGPDQYFVLGDNRDSSFDSRRFGPISRDSIVGKAWVRGWPFSRVGTFDVPNYNL